jgi:hypothetical protein
MLVAWIWRARGWVRFYDACGYGVVPAAAAVVVDDCGCGEGWEDVGDELPGDGLADGTLELFEEGAVEGWG